MTEVEWLVSDEPHVMLRFVRHWASQRKLRLCACGYCRISHWFMSLQGARSGVELAELWADGLVQRSHVCGAALPIDVFSDGDDYDFSHSAVERGLCSEDPYIALQYALPWVHQNRVARNLIGSDLLRCVFGNPFHYYPSPIQIDESNNPARRLIKGLYEFVKLYTEGTEPLDKLAVRRKPVPKVNGLPPKHLIQAQSWLTSDVLVLAKQMYESRDFGAMPILADALQDAGCDNDDILNHCRTEGVHVRGCWVVDLVLGKE